MKHAAPPKDDADWTALRAEIIDAFTPGAPIDEVSLFAGRQTLIQRLRDAVSSKGRHAVVFGERGTGKTSLVNIFHLGQFQPRHVTYVYVQCSQDDSFETLWQKALRRIVFHSDTGEVAAQDLIVGTISPDELEVVLANFTQSSIPIIVFDEFDRIKDDRCKLLMSETIKQLSNSPQNNVTIVIVGVAGNITQLVRQHASVSRNIVQIRMPRMTREELQQIVSTRLQPTPITITGDALWRVAYLSSGLPFYAHSLGQASAISCIKNRKLHITEEVIRNSIENCFADVDQILIDCYVKAVFETRKGNQFKWVIAACALAEQDELGRFSATDVAEPLSAIRGEVMDPTGFTFHLNDLCSDERGSILEREGARGRYRYRFVQPIIQPFIIMKSLATGVLTELVLDKFKIDRQRQLPL
jgi:hypothetical protein